MWTRSKKLNGQILESLMDAKVILVDDEDKLVGYSSLQEAHTGRGKHHRAFVTLLFDSQNKILLQKRKHKLFDGLWDLTAVSHPLRLNGKDESYLEASDRALRKEMGIDSVSVVKIGGFNYLARDGKNCENEYCAILVGGYDGTYKPNPKEVYEVKKVDFRKVVSDVLKNPQKYTPWARKAVEELKRFKSLPIF